MIRSAITRYQRYIILQKKSQIKIISGVHPNLLYDNIFKLLSTEFDSLFMAKNNYINSNCNAMAPLGIYGSRAKMYELYNVGQRYSKIFISKFSLYIYTGWK